VAALNVLPQPRAGTLREVFAYDRANVKMLATGRVAAMRRSLFGGSRLHDRGTGAIGAGAVFRPVLTGRHMGGLRSMTA
jgi:hypothetical protein